MFYFGGWICECAPGNQSVRVCGFLKVGPISFICDSCMRLNYIIAELLHGILKPLSMKRIRIAITTSKYVQQIILFLSFVLSETDLNNSLYYSETSPLHARHNLHDYMAHRLYLMLTFMKISRTTQCKNRPWPAVDWWIFVFPSVKISCWFITGRFPCYILYSIVDLTFSYSQSFILLKQA